jgi:NAD(P)H dehydrogenase (quinone)
MARIVVIVGHPRSGTLCGAMGAAYAEGAREAGHAVTLLELAELTFDPILHEAYERVQPLEPDLATAREALLAAEHMVIVFPLWLGTMPALLKGFLERVLQPDIIEPAREGRFVQIWQGKSARVVVTMGMPGLVYRWWFGAHALAVLRRNILGFMGVSPIATTLHGSIESASAETRAGWLAEMREFGRRAG